MAGLHPLERETLRRMGKLGDSLRQQAARMPSISELYATDDDGDGDEDEEEDD